MSKKMEEKLARYKKWLDRNDGAGSTVKLAQAALSMVEKAILEAQSAKVKYAAAVLAREKALVSMSAAMEKARMEKKLKAKESRLQGKLASLVAGEKTDQTK